MPVDMTDAHGRDTPPRGWWEEYACGCVSETVRRKKDLLGYCPTHGDDRRRVWKDNIPRRVEAEDRKRRDRIYDGRDGLNRGSAPTEKGDG